MDADKFDELFASMARPYSVYACATAIAICCLVRATASEALPLAAGIVAGVAYLRSTDKKTAVNAPNPQPTNVGKTG